MKEVKIILYPIAGVFQFYLANQFSFPGSLLFIFTGIGLIGLAILYLRKAILEGGKEPGKSGRAERSR